MRTTLDIEADVLAVARSLAAAEGRSIGSIVSRLARRGLLADLGSAPGLGGFPVFDSGSAKPITSEQVRAALEEA